MISSKTNSNRFDKTNQWIDPRIGLELSRKCLPASQLMELSCNPYLAKVFKFLSTSNSPSVLYSVNQRYPWLEVVSSSSFSTGTGGNFHRLSRKVVQRLHRKSQWQARGNDAIATLNELAGYTGQARCQCHTPCDNATCASGVRPHCDRTIPGSCVQAWSTKDMTKK